MSDTIVAGLVGGAVAVLLKLFDVFVAKNKNVTDDTAAFRHDLMTRIDQLSKDVEFSRKEGDEWQAKYLAEREIRLKQEWQIQMLGWIDDESGYKGYKRISSEYDSSKQLTIEKVDKTSIILDSNSKE